jgi:hypothetical protein
MLTFPSTCVAMPHCFILDSLCLAANHSMGKVLTPLTLPNTNESICSSSLPQCAAVVPHSAVVAPAAFAYSAPYAACGVPNARPLLPGQPLPQGLAAFALAVPAPLQY